MTLLVVFSINIFGLILLGSFEKKKGTYARSETWVMGEWPYNLVLIAGMGAVYIFENNMSFIITLTCTGIFYLCAIYNQIRKQ